MDILRDASWQAVIGLLGIVVAVAIYLLQRNKKRLTYTVVTETPMLSIDEALKGKIEIKYEKKRIQNIYLVILKIENKGNVDIASVDYEQPIVFSFPDSEILNVEIIDVSPKNLKPIITTELSRFIINPILLNKKDYIVSKLLLSKYERKIDVDARIIGVKDVGRVNIAKENWIAENFWVILVLLILLLGSVFVIDFLIR